MEQFIVGYEIVRLMKNLIYIWGLALVLAGCKHQDPLVDTWKITRVSIAPSGLSTPESHERTLAMQAMSAGLRNSTFALYEGQKSAFFSTQTPYRQGQWSVESNRLSLQLGDSTTPYVFEIQDFDHTTLVLTLIDANLTDGEVTLVCQKSGQYQNDGLDLLSPEQNLWRVRPDHKETKEEIKARARAHLDYLIHYFECVEDNKQTFFETGIISSPFVFYAHGLGLSQSTRFAKRWQESYFDQADARVGFNYLKEALRSIKKYPKAESYTKEYLLAFKQMRPYFDQ